jgi:hypothetical protein
VTGQTPLSPLVTDLARKVFEAMQREELARGTPPDYFTSAWTIFIGPAAFGRLRAEAPRDPLIVGQTWASGARVTKTGDVTEWNVLGVKVQPDVRGPLRLWRLADIDGTTIVWGESAE